MTLEREIYSIETANINKETLEAMKNASKAMKEIHGGLTIDKVDQTMYVGFLPTPPQKRKKRRLTDTQGRTPGTARHRRRNRRGYYAIHWESRPRRRGAGRGTRGAATGGAGQQDVDDGKRTSRRQGWNITCSTTRRFVSAYPPSLKLVSGPILTSVPLQSKGSHQHRQKTTKKKNCGNYKPKWPCKPFAIFFIIDFLPPQPFLINSCGRRFYGGRWKG